MLSTAASIKRSRYHILIQTITQRNQSLFEGNCREEETMICLYIDLSTAFMIVGTNWEQSELLLCGSSRLSQQTLIENPKSTIKKHL